MGGYEGSRRRTIPVESAAEHIIITITTMCRSCLTMGGGRERAISACRYKVLLHHQHNSHGTRCSRARLNVRIKLYKPFPSQYEHFLFNWMPTWNGIIQKLPIFASQSYMQRTLIFFSSMLNFRIGRLKHPEKLKSWSPNQCSPQCFKVYWP